MNDATVRRMDEQQIEDYLRELSDAPDADNRKSILDDIQEEHPELLGETMIAMIEYQAAVIDHLTSQLAEVEFPREGKRLDLKDVEVDGNA